MELSKLLNKGALSSTSVQTGVAFDPNICGYYQFLASLFVFSVHRFTVNCNTYSNLIYLVTFIYLHISKLPPPQKKK